MERISVSVRRGEATWIAEYSYAGTHYTSLAVNWIQLEGVMRETLAEARTGPISFDWSFSDPDLNDRYRALVEARRAAQYANGRMEKALRDAARSFVDVTSTRDAGSILGYSHQYIAKVVK